MQKKRQKRMSERRRAEVVTRKVRLDTLRNERCAEIARLVCESLEPYILQMVKAEVAKAMADLAERQHKAAQQCAQKQS